jgi:hypothetical protein
VQPAKEPEPNFQLRRPRDDPDDDIDDCGMSADRLTLAIYW